MKRTHGLDEREMELVKLLMADCQTTGDIQAKLKKLFAGTIEQMLEAEMDEHLGYEKNSVAGNNSGNSRKQDVCAAAPQSAAWTPHNLGQLAELGTGTRRSSVTMASAKSLSHATETAILSLKSSKSDRQEPTRSNRKSCRCTRKINVNGIH